MVTVIIVYATVTIKLVIVIITHVIVTIMLVLDPQDSQDYNIRRNMVIILARIPRTPQDPYDFCYKSVLKSNFGQGNYNNPKSISLKKYRSLNDFYKTIYID